MKKKFAHLPVHLTGDSQIAAVIDSTVSIKATLNEHLICEYLPKSVNLWRKKFISYLLRPLAVCAFAVTMMFCSSRENSNRAEIERKQSITPLSKGFVFGDNRPFKQCHASTIVRTGDGKFLIAWFGGTHEKHADVGIWMSKGSAKSWSAPVEVAKLREVPHWNPVLSRTAQGGIILYFKIGKTIDEWETWFMKSNDHGSTWSVAQELVSGDKGGRGPVRNKPIVLSSGSLLAGASKETKGVWNAFVDRSEDAGKTWSATPFLELDRGIITGEGVIQPTLWESNPGTVHMLLRSSAGVICRSDSKDNGLSWSPIYKTSLPNPNSGIDLTKLDDGTLVLVYNHDNRNWGARRPLSLTVSTDNGETWPLKFDLETGDDGDEFSYPAVINFSDTIAVSYTWKRQSIAFWMGRLERSGK